jgi:uncharacterized lipoprotein YmbA
VGVEFMKWFLLLLSVTLLGCGSDDQSHEYVLKDVKPVSYEEMCLNITLETPEEIVTWCKENEPQD